MLKTYSEGNLISRGREFAKHPGLFILNKSAEYGDSFRIKIPLRNAICTTDPEFVAYVLKGNQKNYRKSFAYKQLRLALGMGLVTSEGDFWRKQRRMAQPAFYKTQLEELFRGMIAETSVYAQDLEKSRGEVLDISEEMMKITAKVVLRTLFSNDGEMDFNEMYRQMVGAQEYVVHRINRPLMRPFNYINGRHRRFLKDKKSFDTRIFKLVNERRGTENPPNDLLTMLLQAKDADTGEQMSETQLRDEAVTIFAAGHETSANALAWTLDLLAKNPRVVKKLRKEIETVLGDREPGFQDLMQLQYTKQVLEEGMRLYPPAHAVGREAIEADEFKGVKIEKDTIVLLSIFAMHRMEKYFENAQEFIPERFAPEAVKSRKRGTYLPFGAGPRMCIGNHFAMMEMQLILVAIIRRFDLQAISLEEPEMQPLITLKPKENIRLRLV